jgi:uncharacterized protein (TIGR02145 family)
VDGNVYKTVIIGNQHWMAENLKTSKFSDGTPISGSVISDGGAWNSLTTPAWCYYENDASYGEVFGKLYNGFAVSPKSNGGKNLCPTGWHVSTDAEWLTLVEYLGGNEVAADKLKEVGNSHWNVTNSTATNSSLFTALPGGYRQGQEWGNFGGALGRSIWFTSTELTSSTLWYRQLFTNTAVERSTMLKSWGLSIRCVKD